MKIAFNPSTVAALTTPPNNKDITFDLRGHNIFARGVKFCGTDTWRDIKINNVSIGSNTLDLRNGSNTTLTNTNGVVTINSTWRPVVDNLTSNSATSSLSAKQGKVLKALIDGKSDSDHNHDGRYLKLTGGTLTGNLIGTSAMFSGRFYGNGDDEGIIIKPTSNGYAGLILGTHNGERSVFYLTKGNPFWRYNNGSTNLDILHPKKPGTIALTSDIPSSLKNPYSLTTFGVVYDGSVAKTVTTSNFISLIGEGTSVVTDGTMFVTSWASNSGFADTNAVNVPYKRKAVHLWEYIKGKTDSLYATKSHNHDGRYVRAFGTSNDNINSDWGLSFKTFDPIPSGTPPELNPNISLLSIGENFLRRKLLAFIYSNDNIYYRRHVDNGFTNWRRLAFANEIPTSLKNPHALTISLNGTSQGPYDGSAAKNINITPSSIGAATSDHNHDGRYVRYYAVTTLDCNNLAAGLTAARISATNAAHTNHSAYLYISDVGTPFQIQIPDSSIPYIYKRYYGSGKWSGWFKLNAGYADSAGSAIRLTSLGGYTYDNLSTDIPTNAVSYKIVTSGGTDLGDSQYNVLHIPWSSGDWGTYLLFGANNGRFGVKYKHSGIVREVLDSSNYTSILNNTYLPLAGGTMNGNARIGHGSGNLYIGNSGNDGWIYTQDIASLLGTASWNIRTSGAARFGRIHIASKNDESANNNVIESDTDVSLHLNYFNNGNITLCNGGGNVGIDTTAPTQRLDVNGNIRTTGNLYISHATNNNMNHDTSNPRIVFSESGSLAVALVYTDYDSYRASKGLKVMDVDNNDPGNVWFEVLGYNYSSGYVKNGSNDNYVLLGGGGHKLESALNVANANTVGGYHYNDFTYKKYIGYNRNGPYNMKVFSMDISSITWGSGHLIFDIFSSGYANNRVYFGRYEVSLGHWNDTDKNPTVYSRWIFKTNSAYDCVHVVKDLSSYKVDVYIESSLWDCSMGLSIVASSGFNMISSSPWVNLPSASSNILIVSTTYLSFIGNADTATNAYHLRINSANTWSTWYLAGLSGLPSWLWGSNDGTNMYVWNPSNFNVNTALYLRSLGNLNCQTGRTLAYGDVYSYNTYNGNTGSPTTYSSVIGFGRGIGGTVEIAGGWCDTNLYWRSLRDCCEDWYSWRTVLDSNNYTEFIGNYYWANVKISTSSSTTTSPTVSNLTATNSIKMSDILLEHTNEINSTSGIHLNYGNSGNVSLCQGGGNVGIGTTTPSYKLDVNGLMRASGFHHSSVNSDNYILLAGGGYKSFGGNYDNPIFLGYLNLDHGNDGTISSSFYCLGYSVPFTYTRGGNYCRISIPDTTHQVFYIKAAIASVHYSGGGMDTWVGDHRSAGAWWLHCYALSANEVRVKGFRNANGNNDSWWGGNPLYSGNDGANRITVCIFGYVTFR